jgi:hypothetical protein
LNKNRGAKPPGNENNITTKDKSTGGLTSKQASKQKGRPNQQLGQGKLTKELAN